MFDLKEHLVFDVHTSCVRVTLTSFKMQIKFRSKILIIFNIPIDFYFVTTAQLQPAHNSHPIKSKNLRFRGNSKS